MRVESSVTSVSWIPSEGMEGAWKIPMELGLGHYDAPPPDTLGAGELDRLRDEDRYRFANELRAYIEVDADGRIAGHGHLGEGRMGRTTVNLGLGTIPIPGVSYETLRPEPEVGDGWVRFVQTVGGRTGSPMPRKVNRPPYVQVTAPTAWTTLSLTIHADGHTEHAVAGASPFPRHWIYDDAGDLVGKSGTMDFTAWSQDHYGQNSPWGNTDAPALVTAVESQLERALSSAIMRGGEKPSFRRIEEGEALVEQGDAGDELFLILDGVFRVEVDGLAVVELGPGAVVGERALIEGGDRTSTLRALTRAKVAVAARGQLDEEALAELAEGHRREDDLAVART